MKLERLFSVRDVRRLFFPSRSERWIKDTFRTGQYGPALRDACGWQFAESAVIEYQRRHAVGANIVPLRSGQVENLTQFKSSRV